MSQEFTRPILGVHATDVGAFATFALDSNLVIGTSGDCMIVGFVAVEGQTSGGFVAYAYIDAVTGSPTDIRCDIYATSGSDPDRYTGSAVGSSGAVDCSSSAGKWVAFSMTGVTLTAGEHYWLVFHNQTGTPESNYVEIGYRSYFDLASAASRFDRAWASYPQTDGFSADSDVSYSPPCVIKFDGGTLWGNPWVELDSLSSDSNAKGIRVRFSEDVVLRGFALYSNTSADGDYHIYKSDGTLVATVEPTYWERNRGRIVLLVSPVTLDGDTDYDIVFTPDVTVGGLTCYMGEASPPTDVQNCATKCSGTQWCYVYGATPGSFSTDPQRLYGFELMIEEIPAQAGGSGGGMRLAGKGGLAS